MKIFISYAHNDPEATKYLDKGMYPYKQSKLIEAWNDRYLLAGDVYDPIIKAKMEESDIILLLISFNYLGSTYIIDEEIPIAVEKFKKGARVVPIILEECAYDDFLLKAFGKGINGMPRTKEGNKLMPVNEWGKVNEAWTIIIKHLIGFMGSTDLSNAGSAIPQPKPLMANEQMEKIQANPEGFTEAAFPKPGHSIKNIFSSTYKVPGSILTEKIEKQPSNFPINEEKNGFDFIFERLISDNENSDEILGMITKIRLEDPEISGIHKKCVVVGAITVSLLKSYNREKVLTLIDFIEDREPLLWERALAGLVIALGGRYDLLDGQIKQKLQSFNNDNLIQESITNLFYVLQFRRISEDENLYRNREVLMGIEFFQKKANWFLPFTNEKIPGELISRNEVYRNADQSILLNDDNIKYLTFLQYNQLTADKQLNLENSLKDEYELRKELLAGLENEAIPNAERTIQNYLVILFSFLYINCQDEWTNYTGSFSWQEELWSLALNETYQIKARAIIADKMNNLLETSGLYEEFLSRSYYKNSGALKFYGYYCIYIKDYTKALNLLLQAHSFDPLNVNLNLQIAYTYMIMPEGDYGSALKYLNYAIILDPLNNWCLKNIGFCYQKIPVPDQDTALSYFLKAYENDTGDYWLLSVIGSCYQNIVQPDFNKSQEFLEKAVAINDRDFNTLADLGYAYQWIDVADFQKAREYHLKAFALDDSNTWNIKNIGYCYMKLPVPDLKKAIRYFKMALDENPEDNWALIRVALSYLQSNPPDYESALQYFLIAFEKEGNKINVEKNIGICFININNPDYNKAKGFLEQALAKEPEDPDILANLGYCFQFSEPPDFIKALEFHLKAYEADKLYNWNIKNIGHCYLNLPTPDYNEALSYLLQANENEKDDDWILKRLGFCYQCLELPDYEKALEFHLKAYAINPGDVWNLQNVATCYKHLPEPDLQKSLEFLLIAYELDDKNPHILTNIGLGYQGIIPANWKKAIEFHLKALEINPDDTWTLQNVAFCYDNLPEPDRINALKFYLKAYDIKPEDDINLSNIGICYQNLTPPDYEKAIMFHLKAHSLSLNDKMIITDLAFCYQRLTPPDLKNAIAFYNQALALDPDDGLILKEIGYCYQDMVPADYNNSYKYFEMASGTNMPPDGLFEVNWGWTALLLNKIDEAETHLLKGIELLPDEASSYFNLGHIEMFRNNFSKAKEYYKRRLDKSASKEEFLEFCRKDFIELEPLGLNKDTFYKVINEVIES